jgi:hypothetical protein
MLHHFLQRPPFDTPKIRHSSNVSTAPEGLVQYAAKDA